MAAKNIYEAILNVKVELDMPVGTSEERLQRAAKELRDYFAHETMKVGNEKSKELKQATALDLFEKVFKGVSTEPPPKKTQHCLVIGCNGLADENGLCVGHREMKTGAL